MSDSKQICAWMHSGWLPEPTTTIKRKSQGKNKKTSGKRRPLRSDHCWRELVTKFIFANFTWPFAFVAALMMASLAIPTAKAFKAFWLWCATLLRVLCSTQNRGSWRTRQRQISEHIYICVWLDFFPILFIFYSWANCFVQVSSASWIERTNNACVIQRWRHFEVLHRTGATLHQGARHIDHASWAFR